MANIAKMEKGAAVKTLNATSMLIAKSAAEMGKQITTHCMDIAMHVQVHRDVTPAEFFLSKLQKLDKETGKNHSVVRTEAIKRWLTDFAFVSFSADKPATLSKDRIKKANAGTKEEPDFKAHNITARANPWNRYTVEPGDMTTPFLIDKATLAALEALAKRREAAIKHEGAFERQTAKAREANVVSSATFDALMAIRDTLKAEAAANEANKKAEKAA